jgi:hypothetical protein
MNTAGKKKKKRATGRKVRPIRDVTSRDIRKEGWVTPIGYSGLAALRREQCDAYPLLGNDPVKTFPLKRVTTIGRPLLGNVSANTPGQQHIRCWAT